MTSFWILAALMAAAAMAFVLLPVLRPSTTSLRSHDEGLLIDLYRDRMADIEREHDSGRMTDDAWQTARDELEQQMLNDLSGREPVVTTATTATRPSAILLGLLVPVLALLIYARLSDAPGGLPPEAVATQGNEAHGIDAIGQMVVTLENRLRSNPDDLEGWAMLGRSYLFLERYAEAVAALERVLPAAPSDPQVLTDLAEASGMANGGNLTGRPTQWLEQALQVRPDHPKALWLAGLAAFQQERPAQALRHWQTLQAQLPPDADSAEVLGNAIAQAREMAGTAAAPTPDTPPAPAGATTVLEVQVTLDPQIADRVQPDDTVMVFARAIDGPRMPLAVVRRRASELPFALKLDDSMAMAPGRTLSSVAKVEVIARVSRQGGATAQSGDLQGQSGPLDTGAARPVQVTIRDIVP